MRRMRSYGGATGVENMKLKIALFLIIFAGSRAFAADLDFVLLYTGTAEKIQAAIDKGATVGQGALATVAQANRDARVVDVLLKAGAKIDEQQNGKSALMLAAQGNTAEMISALVKAGADVNAKDTEGKTALMDAVVNPAAFQALLKAGAKVDAKDNNGRSVLVYLLGNPDDSELLEMLPVLFAAGADANAADQGGQTALMSAISKSAAIITALLKAGAKADVVDRNGQSLLMFAAKGHNADIIPVLIKAGAKVNLKNSNGQTALLIAADPSYGEGEENSIILALLKAGEDVNAQDKEGISPLMSAAKVYAGSISAGSTSATPMIVDELLKAGAKPDLKDQNGNTYTFYMPKKKS